MRCLNKKFVFILFIFFTFRLSGQDLFSISKSTDYADYLFAAGEYELAAREFERIVFLDSTDLQAKIMLIKSYKQQGDYKTGISKSHVFFKNYASIPPDIDSDFGKMLLYEKQYDETEEFLKQNIDVSDEKMTFFRISSLMLQENYQEACIYLDQNTNIQEGYISDYSKLLQLEKEYNYKKPGVSILLSSVIPGSGKVYSGYWKDGLISFIFVIANAYQSYRGFDKNGIESAYGWIFGGFAAGFYIGNLYGSGKAADKHNNVFRHKMNHQVEEVFNSYH